MQALPCAGDVAGLEEGFEGFAAEARHLINMVGANRIVIGTDNPFDMAPKGAALQVGQVDAILGLTAAEREWICSNGEVAARREVTTDDGRLTTDE